MKRRKTPRTKLVVRGAVPKCLNTPGKAKAGNLQALIHARSARAVRVGVGNGTGRINASARSNATSL